MQLPHGDGVTFADEQAAKQAAYRALRAAWAEALGRPIPKRKRRATHLAPGVYDAAEDEAG